MAILNERAHLGMTIPTYERIRSVSSDRTMSKVDVKGSIQMQTQQAVMVQMDVCTRVGDEPGRVFDHPYYRFTLPMDADLSRAALYALLLAEPDFSAASEA